MAKMSYLKLFLDFDAKTKRLTDEEVGSLIRAMIAYAKTGVELDLVGSAEVIFPVFQAQIDDDSASYDDVSEKRKAAGSKGGKAKQANAAFATAKPRRSSKCYQEKEEEKEEENISQSVVCDIRDNDDELKEFAKLRAKAYGHEGDTRYISSILRDWEKNGVKTVEDARRLTEAFEKRKTAPARNFQQHQYTEEDFGEDFYYDPKRDFLEGPSG